MFARSGCWLREVELFLRLRQEHEHSAEGNQRAADELPIEQVAKRWIVASRPEEVVETMRFYQSGARDNPVMVSVAKSLDEEQLRALAIYFGSLKPAPKTQTATEPAKKKEKELPAEPEAAKKKPEPPPKKHAAKKRLDGKSGGSATEGLAKSLHLVGIPDRFIEHGSRADCLTAAGLDAAGITRNVTEWWRTHDAASALRVVR